MSHHGVNHSIRVPPDSTGKSFGITATTIINYSSGTNQFTINDIIIGQNSGAKAIIFNLTGTLSSGIIYCNVMNDSPTQNFENGEILLVDNIPYATLSTSSKEYVQKFNLSGGNNSYNTQFIDGKGASYIRFSEGEQQLDAFGASKTSHQNLINNYLFYYSDLGTDFTTEIIGGTLNHLPQESSLAFDIGTSAGDKIIRTTNKYHPYQPGFGQTILMTIACGDIGKANVRRRWGYFDGYNGLYFELNGTDISVNIRSTASGITSEESIPQSEWNTDKANGSGGLINLSSFNLDVSKINLYWIDFAWLGAGRVRFGVYDNSGNRITLHMYKSLTHLPYMGRPNLPLRYEIENLGVSSSPSRLKITCSSVISEGEIIETRDKKTYKSTIDSLSFKTIDDTSESPIISFRSSANFNGIVNRLLSVPELFSVLIKDRPVLLRMYKNVNLVGEDFNTFPNTAVDVDTSATSFTGGIPMITWLFNPGSYNENFPNNFSILGEAMYLAADGSHGTTYTIAAKSLDVGSAQIFYTMTFVDVI